VRARLFEERGVTIDRTYQLNVGGNMDFKNMLERERLISKKISKTQAVTSNVGKEFEARDIHVGPSDYVGWLDDRKFAFVRLEGHNFGGAPVSLEYKLEVWDSPNSAGVVIDAIRAQVSEDECYGTFNMGIGFILIVPPDEADAVIATLKIHGEDARIIGQMETGDTPLRLQ